jgi:hypothetical protein
MRCCACLVASLLLAAIARADTLDVPGDFATIQAALNASVSGDVVLVAPGTWLGGVSLPSHSVTLESSGGAAVTVIDAQGSGPAVTLLALPASASAVVRGFTLTGGTGLVPSGGGLPSGGGVHASMLFNSSLLVEGCLITDNHVPGSGGGVYVRLSHFDMRDTEVSGNTAGQHGGGAYIQDNFGAGVVQDCVVRGNAAVGDGGGLWLVGTGITGSVIEENTATSGGGFYTYTPIFTDTVVRANVATLDGGGGYVWNALSPGSQMLFEANHAGRDGGGFLARRDNSTIGSVSLATDVVVRDNSADSRGGGGALLGNSTPSLIPGTHTSELIRFEITGNQAGGEGGGLYVDLQKGFSSNHTYGFTLRNATLSGNTAAAAGGLWLSLDGATRIVRSTITWGNSAGALVLPPGEPAFDVKFSDVQGGWPGVGNIDADPLFVDAPAGDFTIKGGSPCLDTGDPAAAPDADGSQADMGARAFQPWTVDGPGLAGAAGTPSLVGQGLNEPGTSAQVTLSGAAPLAPAFIVLGDVKIAAPFKGGTLVPEPDWVVPLGLTDASGGLDLASTWPPLPSDTHVWVQMWFVDGSGPAGFTASNGLLAITR